MQEGLPHPSGAQVQSKRKLGVTSIVTDGAAGGIVGASHSGARGGRFDLFFIVIIIAIIQSLSLRTSVVDPSKENLVVLNRYFILRPFHFVFLSNCLFVYLYF